VVQDTPVSSWMLFFFLICLMFMAFLLIRRFVPRPVDRRQPGWGPWVPSKEIHHSAAPGDAWARASICIAIGAVVPVVAFTFTWLADQSHRVHDEIWCIPLVITLVCVFVAGRLARKLFDSGQRAMQYRGEAPDGSKPTVDDDAFDVVSRRG
jgi:predicted permease